MNKKTILFLRNVNASWAIRDRELLKENYIVYDCFVSKGFYFNLIWIIKLIKSDILFCWFASLSFFPIVLLGKLLNKKIIIISGGFDAAKAPEVSYGAFTKGPLNQWFRRKLFKMANKIICVSEANMRETINNANVSPTQCEVIYHGFEPSIPEDKINPWNSRKNQIVMISNCSKDKFYVKGIDQFLQLAQIMPHFDFVLIGSISKDFQNILPKDLPSNLTFKGFLPFNSSEFCNILNDSKYIVQLSYYESFGCAVIDGTIAGCFPLVFSQFALPELIQFEGKIFNFGDLEEIRNFINSNEQDEFNTKKISFKYLDYFSLDKRKSKILSCLESL